MEQENNQLKNYRFIPIIFGVVSFLFLFLVIVHPLFSINYFEGIVGKMLLFTFGFITQVIFYCFDGLKIGTSSFGVMLIELIGVAIIIFYVMFSFGTILINPDLTAILAGNILLMEILKIFIALFNKDNTVIYRIWLLGESIISLVFSILVLIYSKGNASINLLMIFICLLFAIISNLLYSILWKTDEGIKGIIMKMNEIKKKKQLFKEKSDM